MIFYFGSRLYGRIDKTPGLGYVATKFAHIWFLPLIPMGSWFVVSESGNGWSGKPIGLSGRSILVTYMRSVGIAGALLCAAMAGVSFADRGSNAPAWIVLGVAAACVGIAVWGYRLWREPSQQRVGKLLAELGVDEDAAEQEPPAPDGDAEPAATEVLPIEADDDNPYARRDA